MTHISTAIILFLLVCVGPAYPASARRPAADTTLNPTTILRCQARTWSLPFGSRRNGALRDGVLMPLMQGATLLPRRMGRQWGTAELIAALAAGVRHLQRNHRRAGPIVIGDLSRRHGGHLPPHKSHQSGLDADVGLMVKNRIATGFHTVGPATFDADATWSFLEPVATSRYLELIFIDRTLIGPLRGAAKRAGWPAHLVDRFFRKHVRHEPHHKNHLHLRLKPQRQACPRLWSNT